MDLADGMNLAYELDQLQVWDSKEIMVELQHGVDGVLQEVNLVTVLEEIPATIGRRKFMDDRNNRYYLPSRFNTNSEDSRRNEVVPYMAQACAQVGIEIRNRGWQDVPQKLTLKCIRGRVYTWQQSRKNLELLRSRQGNVNDMVSAMVNPETGYKYSKPFQERKSKTARPTDEDMQCPFQIVLKWEPDDCLDTGRWYIFHGNMVHRGHHQKNPNEIQLYLCHHDRESTRLAVNAMTIHLGSGSATQLLVRQHTNSFFMPSQLATLRRSENHAARDPEAPLTNPNLSPAERLLHYLQAQKDLSYCALFANVDIGESFVSIRKKRGHRMQFRNLEMSSAQTNGLRDTEIIQTENLVAAGETDTPKSHTDRILGALTVASDSGEKRLFLGVAWVSDERRRLATCFPGAWGVDVTFGPNAEQRPLKSATLKMSTNETMTHFHSFLPCVARWAYSWSFGVAMPKLLGRETLQRNNAVCTDGEEKQYGPLVVLANQEDSPWQGTEHYLCIYHLVDRQLGREGLKGRVLGPIGENYQSVVICWIYSWSSDMDTYQAFYHSYNLLMMWLRTEESMDETSPRKAECLGPELCDWWAAFIHSKILPHASKFVFAQRLKTRSFNLRTTSNTEG